MKILHIGGYWSITSALAKYQNQAGHKVKIMGSSTQEDFLRLPPAWRVLRQELDAILAEHFDVVQFHLAQSICDKTTSSVAETKSAIEKLAQSGTVSAYYSYGNDLIATPAYAHAAQFILQGMSHIFMGNHATHQSFGGATQWSWLAPAMDFQGNKFELPQPPPSHQMHVIHIVNPDVPSDRKIIERTLAQVAKKGLKFRSTLMAAENAVDLDIVRAAIQGAHVIIEQVDSDLFGVIALESMSCGKAVVSGNSSAAKKAWATLSMAPVIDANPQNLTERLESILREPKCLKDLAPRGRAYVEKYHNADTVSKIMLDVYEQISARAHPSV